jgi:hypothetical protein
MTVAQPADRWRRTKWIAVFFIALFVVLAVVDASMIPPPGGERCPYKIPKWFGCVLANHESLSGSVIGVAGALFAAVSAWRAIMAQIESDRDLTRMAERAYVTGGPGGRLFDQNANQIGIMSTGMNTVRHLHFRRRSIGAFVKRLTGLVWAKIGPRSKRQNARIGKTYCPLSRGPGNDTVLSAPPS